jgi:hypothetical protein
MLLVLLCVSDGRRSLGRYRLRRVRDWGRTGTGVGELGAFGESLDRIPLLLLRGSVGRDGRR